jgi:putative PIN family toxin of toxin-antitoxin system
MPPAVLDSTVLISAFLTRTGVSNELLQQATEGAFTIHLSPYILDETQGVLLDETRRFRRRYRYPNESVIEFMDGVRALAHLVTDLPTVAAVPRDPNDNPVVATALKARASYLVTRDDDLLSLQEYEGITMITPEDFMALLRRRQ